jgi:hypothetical protein
MTTTERISCGDCDANPKPKHHDVHLDVDDVDGDDDNLDGAVDVNE